METVVTRSKPKNEMVLICECGFIPEKDESKSTENWNVYDPVCKKCGKRMNLKFKDEIIKKEKL